MSDFIAQDSSLRFGMTDYFVISTAGRNLALSLRFLPLIGMTGGGGMTDLRVMLETKV